MRIDEFFPDLNLEDLINIKYLMKKKNKEYLKLKINSAFVILEEENKQIYLPYNLIACKPEETTYKNLELVLPFGSLFLKGFCGYGFNATNKKIEVDSELRSKNKEAKKEEIFSGNYLAEFDSDIYFYSLMELNKKIKSLQKYPTNSNSQVYQDQNSSPEPSLY